MPEIKPSVGSELKGAISRKLDEAGLSQHDYVKAALKWQYNWIGLAGAAAFALIAGTGLPLVLAAGLEMMYVALVPQTSPFRRLVRSWKYAEQKREHQKRLDEMYRNIPPDMRSRYAYVQQVAQAIRANYSQLSYASQVFATQMEAKLAGLLEGYVRLLCGTRATYIISTPAASTSGRPVPEISANTSAPASPIQLYCHFSAALT
jgi:hypothetical protein